MGNKPILIRGNKQRTTKSLRTAFKELRENKSKEFYSLKKYSDDELVRLMKMLAQARIRVLELGGGLTDLACSTVASAIGKRQCPIVELQLQGNDISDSGVKVIAEALENSSIEKLDLSWNQIGDDGAKYLAEAIRKSSLKSLDLAYNQFTDVGAAYLESAIKESRLRRLTLSGNARVSRFTLDHINEKLAVLSSDRFRLAEVLCSARFIKRIGNEAPLRDLPVELLREIIVALYGERRNQGK